MKQKIRLLSYTELKQKITEQQNPIAQHLGAYLYAACARKGEITRPDYYHAPKRAGEMSILNDDLYFERNLLRLRVKTTKTKSDSTYRIIPLNPEKEKWLCELLVNWQQNHKTYLQNLNLLHMTKNELFPLSASFAYYVIKKNFGFNPHKFRAMRATHYLLGNVTGKSMPIDKLAIIGGWSNLQTIQRSYSGVMMEDIANVV